MKELYKFTEGNRIIKVGQELSENMIDWIFSVSMYNEKNEFIMKSKDLRFNHSEHTTLKLYTKYLVYKYDDVYTIYINQLSDNTIRFIIVKKEVVTFMDPGQLFDAISLPLFNKYINNYQSTSNFDIDYIVYLISKQNERIKNRT